MVVERLRVLAYAAPRALQRALCRLVLRFSGIVGVSASFESFNTDPSGAQPPGGGPISIPYGVDVNSDFGGIHSLCGYSLATALGVPLRLHYIASASGPPTSIFVSHLL